MKSSRFFKQPKSLFFVAGVLIASIFVSTETAAARSSDRLPVEATSTHAHLQILRTVEVARRLHVTARRAAAPAAVVAVVTAPVSAPVAAAPAPATDATFVSSGDRFDPMNGAL